MKSKVVQIPLLVMFLSAAFAVGAVLAPMLVANNVPVAQDIPEVPVAEVFADDELAEDVFTVRRALSGLGAYQTVGDMLLLSEDAAPKQVLVGHLVLSGDFGAASLMAETFTKREVVPVQKVRESEWLIKGTGRVIVLALLSSDNPLRSEIRRFDVTIGTPEPDPVDPVDPVKPVDPVVPVPTDRFDNLGQRVAAAAAGLPLRKEVAANYRKYADQLEGSVEAQEISLAMVEARDAIIKTDKLQWQPVLQIIIEDFTKRRPDMLRNDVVDHWRATANGLDPQ